MTKWVYDANSKSRKSNQSIKTMHWKCLVFGGRWRTPRSHSRISGTLSSLRTHPVDVLRRTLDIASLTMYAVLSVDLQSVAFSHIFRHILVDPGRTKASLRSVENGEVAVERYVVVFQSQVRRLIVVVIRSGQADRIWRGNSEIGGEWLTPHLSGSV